MRGLIMGAVIAAAAGAASADTIAYWNFNDSDLTVDGGAGTLTTDFVAANVTYFGGSATNAQGGDPAGQALALQGGTNNVNNGRNITFQISTSNFENLVMTFATRRTGTGFNSNQVAYSLNGSTFTNFDAAYNPPDSTTFELKTFDFSSITALDDAASVFVRITFNGVTSSSGNNRIDNVLFTADPIVIPLPPAAFAGIAGLGLAGIASRIRRR